MEAILSNTKLNFQYLGNRTTEGPLLLFLHEALGSIGQWKDFPETLCNKLHLPGLIYERQGHGKSSPLNDKRQADYLHNYALDELPAFLDSIDENRKLILVGHSDGGTIALLFASAFPERVQNVITMAAHVINEAETIAGIAPAVKAYESGKLDGLRKYHGEKTASLFYAWADIWRSDAFEKWDITDKISESHLSGLFVQGKDDQYGTRKQLDLISENYKGPHELLFLENCGHHPHLEQPEVVMNAISEFISSSL